MERGRWPVLLRTGAIYFALAVLAIELTRFGGGVALLWFANAYLTAELLLAPRKSWPRLIAAAAIGSVLATGFFGLGWERAPVLVAANLVEAFVAAFLLRKQSRQSPLESLAWLGHLIVASALAAPLVSAIIVAAVPMGLPTPPLTTFVQFFTGHALSALTFTPLFLMLLRGELQQCFAELKERRVEAIGLSAATTAITIYCFTQDWAPLLFVPVLPIILITFRLGRGAAVASILMLSIVGGASTLAGVGPIHFLDAGLGAKAQFFQFFLATMVLTVWPVAADLRHRARLFRELRFSEERYRMLADHSGDIMMHIDLDGRVRFVSPSIRQLGGYEPDEMIGRMATDFVAESDVEHVAAAHDETIAARGETHRFEYRGAIRDGSERWFETLSRAVLDQQGEPDAVLSVIRDVSERKRAEQNLTAAAMTDSLTGLPNRRAFRAAALKALGSNRPVLGCLAVIDLDHFKRINDLHGHDGGDAVLRQFAARALVCLREGDMVARIGGEEFGLLLPAATIDDAARICERLRQSVAAMVVPSPTGGIRVTVSGGVAELGSDGLDAALKRADLALYEAKGGGRDQLCLAA